MKEGSKKTPTSASMHLLEDVRNALDNHKRVYGLAATRGVMTGFGSARLADIPQGKWGELIGALNARTANAPPKAPSDRKSIANLVPEVSTKAETAAPKAAAPDDDNKDEGLWNAVAADCALFDDPPNDQGGAELVLAGETEDDELETAAPTPLSVPARNHNLHTLGRALRTMSDRERARFDADFASLLREEMRADTAFWQTDAETMAERIGRRALHLTQCWESLERLCKA
jgi:hypothetical protein